MNVKDVKNKLLSQKKLSKEVKTKDLIPDNNTFYLHSLLDTYLVKATDILIDPLNSSYTAAHRFCARLKKAASVDLIEQAIVWELALFVWNSDFRTTPEVIYKEICLDHSIDNKWNELATIISIDTLLQDGDYEQIRYTISEIGVGNVIAKNLFKQKVNEYLSKIAN